MFYVAVTRPVNRLYGLVEKGKPNTKTELSNIGQICDKVLSSLTGMEGLKITETNVTLGTPTPKQGGDVNDEVYFSPKNVSDCLWFPDLSLQDEDALEVEHLSEEQRYGNQLHEVLSLAKNNSQLTSVIQTLVKADRIEQEFMQRLQEDAEEVLNNTTYKELFEGVNYVLSEQDLICDEINVKRPDMILEYSDKVVVVDYKTGEARKSHHKQLHNYMVTLKEMGYNRVEGKIIYTSPLNITDV